MQGLFLPVFLCLVPIIVYYMLTFSTCSIAGVNKHYDTPTNPAASERVPGGSSSGAAVAVAAKIVGFSLGKVHRLFICHLNYSQLFDSKDSDHLYRWTSSSLITRPTL